MMKLKQDIVDVLEGKKPVEPTEEPTEPTIEPTEPVTEPVETPATPEPPTEPPTEPTNPIELINKEIGTQFKEAGEIKAFIENYDNEKKTWEQKYSELSQTLEESQNPLSYFANEDEYKRQQLLKNNPELNPAELNRLFSTDLSKLKPEEVIAMYDALRYPELSKEDVIEAVLKKYDYDPEEGKPSAYLVKEAKEALSNLNKLKESVTLPEKVDFESKRQERLDNQNKQIEKTKKDLEPIVNKLVEALNDFELNDGKDVYFKYQIEPDFKPEASKVMMDYLISIGAGINDNTEKDLAEARDYVRSIYLINNHKRIMDAYAAQKVAENDEEWKQKVHNPSKPEEPVEPTPTPKKTDPLDLLKGQSVGKRIRL